MSSNPRVPISFRPGTERQSRITAFMKREGIGQSEALHRLIDLGLVSEGLKEPEAAPAHSEAVDEPQRWAL